MMLKMAGGGRVVKEKNEIVVIRVLYSSPGTMGYSPTRIPSTTGDP